MHNYTPFYHELFSDKRDSLERLFEIGIGTRDIMVNVPNYTVGASLLMWQEYFAKAELHTIDIRADAVATANTLGARIHAYICDQSQSGLLCSFMDRLGGNFDVIIDDGSHIVDHQIISAIALIPSVKTGGVYIIEDVSEAPKILFALKAFGYECEHIVFDPNQKDDQLIVIRR